MTQRHSRKDACCERKEKKGPTAKRESVREGVSCMMRKRTKKAEMPPNHLDEVTDLSLIAQKGK